MSLKRSLKRGNHRAVRAPVIDLEEPEGATKVGIRFRLRGRSTAPSLQSPQVDRESDQSTRKGRHQQGSSKKILGQGPDGAHLIQGLHRFFTAGGGVISFQHHSEMTKLAARALTLLSVPVQMKVWVRP